MFIVPQVGATYPIIKHRDNDDDYDEFVRRSMITKVSMDERMWSSMEQEARLNRMLVGGSHPHDITQCKPDATHIAYHRRKLVLGSN